MGSFFADRMNFLPPEKGLIPMPDALFGEWVFSTPRVWAWIKKSHQYGQTKGLSFGFGQNSYFFALYNPILWLFVQLCIFLPILISWASGSYFNCL